MKARLDVVYKPNVKPGYPPSKQRGKKPACKAVAIQPIKGKTRKPKDRLFGGG